MHLAADMPKREDITKPNITVHYSCFDWSLKGFEISFFVPYFNALFVLGFGSSLFYFTLIFIQRCFRYFIVPCVSHNQDWHKHNPLFSLCALTVKFWIVVVFCLQKLGFFSYEFLPEWSRTFCDVVLLRIAKNNTLI